MLQTPLKVMPIVGTRPEAVKMAPLINLLRSRPAEFDVKVCATAQHREMLDQVMQAFDVGYDYDLNIMQQGQTLTQVTTRALQGLEEVLTEAKPDIVLAQGDTTTVLAASLAAAYAQIAFGHVEAGLRTDNKFDPFPEELNRRLTTQVTDLHFAPTDQSKRNLLREGVSESAIYLTGNTVIDALLQVTQGGKKAQDKSDERMILVTTHRRENLGDPLENIVGALGDILEKFPDTRIVYPMHRNPRRARGRPTRSGRQRARRTDRTVGLSAVRAGDGARALDFDRFGRRAGRSASAGHSGFGVAPHDRTARRRERGHGQFDRHRARRYCRSGEPTVGR